MYAAGLIEDSDGNVLITRAPSALSSETRWRFPRGEVEKGESPEAAMRRIVRAHLGLHIEIIAGQPPIAAAVNRVEAELRYFFCGVAAEDSTTEAGVEVRWVAKGQLREYDFDEASISVARWLGESIVK